ncbi:MAG TPA: deoxyribonuclease IV [Spirochaetia bacterium]|nr:deoxyribonuclease IV [Spirochaetia bacterium]
MKYVGAHVSTTGGVENAPINAKAIGARAFALFTRNQRQWASKPLNEESIRLFKENLAASGIRPEHVLPHDSYLINIGGPDKEIRKKSLDALYDETFRASQLEIRYLNFHPGSHLKQMSEEECLILIAEGMNEVLSKTKGVALLIEGTAGQGSNVGYRFEHLASIIAQVEDKKRVGVCLDTCHTFAAGYDLRSPEAYAKTMEEFGKVVGFKYLKGMHLNDSKYDFGTKKDRHDGIGKGFLGLDAFRNVMNDPRLNDIPMILETNDPDRWAEEIELLYGMIK